MSMNEIFLQKNDNKQDEVDSRQNNLTDGMAKVDLDNQKKEDEDGEVLQRRPKSQKKNLSDDEIHAGLRMFIFSNTDFFSKCRY